MNDKLSLNGSVNYSRNGATNRPGQGYAASIVEGLYVWFGRQVDMNALKQNYLQSARRSTTVRPNREFNWNYSYHNNPYLVAAGEPGVRHARPRHRQRFGDVQVRAIG